MIGLIRADDIDRWASRITPAPEFPRLVRRLVHSTGRGLRKVDFPADEAIRLAGWDGKVLADEASPFVPAGFSAWELGTNQDPRIKQHLRIKSFFGTSENAVKTQVWIAVSVYVLVAIVRKRLDLDASLYETLQILSLTMFETTPLHQLLKLDSPNAISSNMPNQLNLFES